MEIKKSTFTVVTEICFHSIMHAESVNYNGRTFIVYNIKTTDNIKILEPRAFLILGHPLLKHLVNSTYLQLHIHKIISLSIKTRQDAKDVTTSSSSTTWSRRHQGQALDLL